MDTGCVLASPGDLLTGLEGRDLRVLREQRRAVVVQAVKDAHGAHRQQTIPYAEADRRNRSSVLAHGPPPARSARRASVRSTSEPAPRPLETSPALSSEMRSLNAPSRSSPM